MLDDADADNGDSRLSEASRKGSTKSEKNTFISLTKFILYERTDPEPRHCKRGSRLKTSHQPH